MKPEITEELEKHRDEELAERKEKRRKVAEEEAARREKALTENPMLAPSWNRPPPPPQKMEVWFNIFNICHLFLSWKYLHNYFSNRSSVWMSHDRNSQQSHQYFCTILNEIDFFIISVDHFRQRLTYTWTVVNHIFKLYWVNSINRPTVYLYGAQNQCTCTSYIDC